MLDASQDISTVTSCSHCGDPCPTHDYTLGTEVFCCHGCQMVYQMLSEHGLSAYYHYEQQPGISLQHKSSKAFDYLDHEDLVESITHFREGGIAKVHLSLPQIHCSSCLYLLENLNKLDQGIISVRVRFTAREATITYREDNTSLRKIVELLARIGYEPRLHLDQLDDQKRISQYDCTLLYKLGLAGFSFGNIMLLSFPEYLGFDKASYLFHIGYINIILATPVLFYSGWDYIKSAWRGLRMSDLNIDIPIALGMITLYGRSLYEILSYTGEGYLDSFAGFIFFLLVGKWFQSFTNQALDFDRNYKSYFPISATVKSGTEWVTRSLDQIIPGDILRIKNQEIIPADGQLIKGKARVDYSFVTGESDLITKSVGDGLYAGGRHQGEGIEISVSRKVDQSYLTQLWNDDTFKDRPQSQTTRLISWISKYFTIGVLLIASTTMVYWYWVNPDIAFQTFTAVLIVACPCALALAIPFTYGHILRILTGEGFFLRAVSTIEDIQDIDYIIFDKTGTITDSRKIHIDYHGRSLTDDDLTLIRSACSHSSHPLSKAIVSHYRHSTVVDIDSYEDHIGEGIIATLDKRRIRLGSSAFIFGSARKQKERGVFVELDSSYVGYYSFRHIIRPEVPTILQMLLKDYKVAMLSGDTDQDRLRMEQLFGSNDQLYFEQSPHDKLAKIKSLQSQGHKVMMIGDGLNDAGALKQSNVGIVISDEVNNFSPACDGILDASKMPLLSHYIQYLRYAQYIIYGAFTLALLYNSIGLYFAVTGQMSPVIAAILMPLSSISVIIYGVSSGYLLYRYVMRPSSIAIHP